MKRWQFTTVFLGVFLSTILIGIYLPTRIPQLFDIQIKKTKKDRKLPHIPVSKIPKKIKKSSKSLRKHKGKSEKKQPPELPSKDHTSSGQSKKEEKKAVEKLYSGNMFQYDSEREGFVIPDIPDASYTSFYSDNFIKLFKILDKSNRGNLYFQSDDYIQAYKEMEKTYPDVYLWAFLTNTQSKLNLFAYLLKKYSENNKEWSPYKKDKADCTQFSERAYFFMFPGEILIQDTEYFEYLFSDEDNIIERNKRVNKIPTISYVRIDPFIFNVFERRSDEKVIGHAMLAFKTTMIELKNSWILGEPQSGQFVYIDELEKIMPPRLKIESNFVTIGRIISVPPDPKEEPLITNDVKIFMYYNNSYIKREVISENSAKLLKMLKDYLETDNQEYAVIRLVDFIEYKLMGAREQNTSLIQIQEDTSVALNILIRELERIKPESSGDLIMEIDKELRNRARTLGYLEGKTKISNYIGQFKTLALSKLQYWWYFPKE